MELAIRVDQRVWDSLGMWREMDEYYMARRVLRANVSGGQVWGRLKLGWMDGMKMALGSSGMMVETERQCMEDRKEWRAWCNCCWLSLMWPFLHGPALSRTAHHVLWWLSPEEGWDTITWCSSGKLKRGRSSWKSRCRCLVYGLRQCFSNLFGLLPPFWLKKISAPPSIFTFITHCCNETFKLKFLKLFIEIHHYKIHSTNKKIK